MPAPMITLSSLSLLPRCRPAYELYSVGERRKAHAYISPISISISQLVRESARRISSIRRRRYDLRLRSERSRRAFVHQHGDALLPALRASNRNSRGGIRRTASDWNSILATGSHALCTIPTIPDGFSDRSGKDPTAKRISAGRRGNLS